VRVQLAIVADTFLEKSKKTVCGKKLLPTGASHVYGIKTKVSYFFLKASSVQFANATGSIGQSSMFYERITTDDFEP
jgi:hypothetical protein